MNAVNVALLICGILYILACVWLIFVILLQEGKSGGMGGAEAGGQAPSALTDSFGAGGAQKGLFNMTSWTAGVFFVLAIVLTILGTWKEQGGGALGDLAPEPAVATTGTTTEAPAATTTDKPAATTEAPAPAESAPAAAAPAPAGT